MKKLLLYSYYGRQRQPDSKKTVSQLSQMLPAGNRRNVVAQFGCFARIMKAGKSNLKHMDTLSGCFVRIMEVGKSNLKYVDTQSGCFSDDRILSTVNRERKSH